MSPEPRARACRWVSIPANRLKCDGRCDGVQHGCWMIGSNPEGRRVSLRITWIDPAPER